ncbi:MAG: hypothetical protein DI626_06215 [Micavibrio aeruginosavorus]|uniref:Uncharacterized protein n=1 Tax=Micavibrio aeruginosavorus TaxID=349221 RepID=A0A2W5A274_9BACT|nr:MAG: hypothetical protein DI626_06215 [Micavibrio aeruginosavorus]
MKNNDFEKKLKKDKKNQKRGLTVGNLLHITPFTNAEHRSGLRKEATPKGKISSLKKLTAIPSQVIQSTSSKIIFGVT